MNRLIITTDLGHIRIYRVTRDLSDSKPSIELITDHDFPDDHSRFENRDTDAAGRFPRGENSQTHSGMSYGERHGEKAEAEKTQLRLVAGFIDDAVSGESVPEIYLAAPQAIHQRLIDSLDSGVRDCLIETLPLDLNKAEKLELLRRFNLIES
jgi:hypothetical protein